LIGRDVEGRDVERRGVEGRGLEGRVVEGRDSTGSVEIICRSFSEADAYGVVDKGLFSSGVLKAPNKRSRFIAPSFKLSNASLPTFEICESSTTANPSLALFVRPLDAYKSNPISPSIISIVVPGFIVS